MEDEKQVEVSLPNENEELLCGGPGYKLSLNGEDIKQGGRCQVYVTWTTFWAIGSVHFLGSTCTSLQAPFYPSEAESKGASASEYGFVFGIFELVSFISSPFLGGYMSIIGAKKMLCFGMGLAASATICFGLLHYVHDRVTFISLSLILRTVESLGATSAIMCAFSITATIYPDSFGTKFASLETFYGSGFIVGPAIGGFLYSLGGYKAPFIVLGFAMFAGMLVIYKVLPTIETNTHKEAKIMDILKIPAVLLDSICTFATAITMGFLTATLEPHIREFRLTYEWLIFIVSGGTYAVLAPFVGRFGDKWEGDLQLTVLKRLLSLGSLCIVISYSLVGPLPFVGIQKSAPTIVIGLIVHGLGIALLMTPSFIDSIRSTTAMGYPDDISTHSVISGIWSSSFALGAFIGPSVGGILFDSIGFQYGSAIFVIPLHILVFIGISVYLASENKLSSPLKKSHGPCDTATKHVNSQGTFWSKEVDRPLSSLPLREEKKGADNIDTSLN